jgi:hypothetical protein
MMDDLGNRMKGHYEERQRHYLTRRLPVIIRVDGRAFHTLTKGMKRPFDGTFIEAMVIAAMRVFDQMQGCKMAYVQSDEASFVLTDYDDLETQAWFDYSQSKIESVTAALMSVAFGRCLRLAGKQDLATFDARAFNIPESEVANYFLWRAKDWHRNSVQMLAQAHFSHAYLQGLSTRYVLAELDAAKHPWDQLCDVEKNGTFLIRELIMPTDGKCHWQIGERTNVRDRYEEIANLWDTLNPSTWTISHGIKRLVESPVRNTSASSNGATGSKNGTSVAGTRPKSSATKRSKT